MHQQAMSIRPFIGAKDFALSRKFYRELGFEESELENNFSYFQKDGAGFYLQGAYVKDWIDNTMVFLEVKDLDQWWRWLVELDLPAKFSGVRLIPIRREYWGRECFVHDPSGILWHFGEFEKKSAGIV